MIKVIYVEPSGVERIVEVPDGWTLMQGATMKGVGGIDAECGGSCACATCHVYVDESDLARLPPPADAELGLLDSVAAEQKPTSRLSCQIKVTPALDGLVVRMPDRQS